MVSNDWNLSFEGMKRLNRNFRLGDIGVCLWSNKNFSQTRWRRPGARNCKQNSCQNQWRLPCYRCSCSNAMFACDVANAVTNTAVVSNPYLHLIWTITQCGHSFPQAVQTKKSRRLLDRPQEKFSVHCFTIALVLLSESLHSLQTTKND